MSPLVVFPYNLPLILVVSSVTRRSQPATTILAITGNDIKAGHIPDGGGEALRCRTKVIKNAVPKTLWRKVLIT